MTTILQISDTHLVPHEVFVKGRLNPSAALENLVARICALREQLGPIDAVLHSGDISDDGSLKSYQRLEEILAPLKLPVFAIPGNHDARENMRSAFSHQGYLPATGKLHWQKRLASFDMIGIDTLVEGSGGGLVDAEAFSFIEAMLTEAGDRPVLLAIHHPPFACGIKFMDKIGLEGADALANLLQKYNNEIRVVCGHIHNTMIATVGGKVALSGPSSCSAFAFDTRADAFVGFVVREDGFMLHRWQDGFKSVRIDARDDSHRLPF